MASKALSLTSLLLTLNLLFFTLVSSTNHCSCPPSAPTPKPISPPKPKSPLPPAPKPKNPPPSAPTPKPISPPKPKSPLPPAPKPKNPPPSTPKPISPAPPKKETCPIDALKLGVCANVLGGLIGVVVGTPAKEPCCSLLNGLVDLEAAVCLCTAIKANVLGINLNVPVDLSLLLNYCGKKVPTGFQCK